MDDRDEQLHLRLQYMHFSLLSIQHAVSGSRHPAFDALAQWEQSEKGIRNNYVEIPLTDPNPEVHYSLPSDADLRSLSDDLLSQALDEAVDARSGAIHEDTNDPTSPIIHWMPIDVRWARIMLIQREMDRRDRKKIQWWNWVLSAIGVVTSVFAVILSALSLFGFPSPW